MAESVARLEEAAGLCGELEDENGVLKRENEELTRRAAGRAAGREKELAASMPHDPLSSLTASFSANGGTPDQANLREVLEAQGALAGALAARELEVESLLSRVADLQEGKDRSDSHARRMAEQLSAIQSSSEEVAVLEAEEIARLEEELSEVHGVIKKEREERGEREREGEGREEGREREGERMKEEVSGCLFPALLCSFSRVSVFFVSFSSFRFLPRPS